MGTGAWDTGVYKAAASSRKAAGVADFGHDADVRAGRASGIHPDLDPKKVAGPTSPLAGMNVRESRDNADHPESIALAVIFDETGSMAETPMIMQKKLANLMEILVAKTGLKDAQILYGAVGDSFSDSYPFQVGQFESDNRFDEQLRSLILEGGVGCQVMESYGLAWRFAGYHTASDSFEKRGKKGYLFTMGDESLWPTISKDEVRDIFGVEAEADESVESLLKRAQEKWEVFHLFSLDGSYPHVTSIHERWKNLLGERFVTLEDSSLVCEVIAGLIHMMESAYDATKVVDDMGLSGHARSAVHNALVPVGKTRVPRAKGSGNLPKRGSGGIVRV